jgi:hypothetical protein
MTRFRVKVLLIVLAGAGLALAPADRPADAPPARPPSLNDLSLQVAALQGLRKFKITPQQKEVLRKLAPETIQKGDRQPPKPNPQVRKALAELRRALVQGATDERIEDLEDQLDTVLDKEKAELDDSVEITEGARRAAPVVLRLLSVGQVVSFLEAYSGEPPDPMEELLGALNRVGSLKDAEWKDLCDELVDEVGWLLGGLDITRTKAIRDQVDQWLKRVRGLEAKEREEKRAELEKAARRFAAQAPPTQILHHITEHALAELLSNPQLPAALDAGSKPK